MMIADWLQIKQLEKLLKRKLTEPEIRGMRLIRVRNNGTVSYLRIEQVHMLYLHQHNNCK